MTDLESRLKDAMRASVATVEPTFTAADVMRRHDVRIKRLAAMCLAVSMAMAVLAYVLPRQLARVDAASMTVEPLAGHTTSYTDPIYAWSVTYNSAWVEGRSVAGTKPDVVETVRFTNFRSTYRYSVSSQLMSSSTSLSMGWLREFPASGVALQIWNVGVMTTARPLAHETRLPLQVAKFSPVHRFAGGSEPTPMVQVFAGLGVRFKAAVWIGRQASTASEHAIWAAVRSIRFSPLRTGTIWQHRFYVLGPATSYRVNSVTLILSASLPRGPLQRVSFYLVRSPRAFYVVQRRVLVAERDAVYLVRYDARKREFVARGTSLRWSLAGSPVGQIAQPLQIMATESQDGHVLYAPDIGKYTPARPQVESVS
ncbi:MAG TPA: hypothetical protein VFI65_11980 [Streptosporangiaceae bacterium]|nr:hypothetical protein [Streptosporangiaceae bacterium]